MTDGLLDLAVLTYGADFTATTAIRELGDPFNPENRCVIYRQIKEFTLESDRDLFCNLDGEPLRARTLHFTVLPTQLRLAINAK